MDMARNDVRKLSTDEFSAYKHLEHATQQARARNYQDFLIVDVDSHHYENESYKEVFEYIDSPVMRRAALESTKRGGRSSMLNSQVTVGQKIGSVTVRSLFSNSTIDAPRIDELLLGRIQNTTRDVLVAAEADKIGLVRWTFGGKTQTIRNVDNPGPRGLDKDLDNNPRIILQIT